MLKTFNTKPVIHYLTPEQWKWSHRIELHLNKLNDFIENHIQRAHHHIKHPIYDFLFEYYHFRPAQLLNWTPGIHVVILQPSDYFKQIKHGKFNSDEFYIDTDGFSKNRVTGLKMTINLLEKTSQAKSNYACFGLHEWAMVYDKQDIRHAQLKLRLQHDEIKAIIEASEIKCTHYDAYRFFSKNAVSLNIFSPTKDNRDKLEQSACLHANMDVYRWAFKYYPWIGSDLIADAFLLAKDIREVDMRASPYDVSHYELAPIYIELADGKKQYIDYQQQFKRRADKLRFQLISRLKDILMSLNVSDT